MLDVCDKRNSLKYLFLFLSLMGIILIGNASCIDPRQILYFDNYLLTRTCGWVEQIDLWRTKNTQYTCIFFGDSLIENGSWGSDVGNQGYGGDTVQLLLQRIDIVINAHPKDVYILVGINDFWREADPKWIFSLYNRIINILKNSGINVHVISTLQCSPSLQGNICVTVNTKVSALNLSLSELSEIEFINADALLSDSKGLKSIYTIDGIHLNKLGYEIIYNLMRKK